MVSNALLLEADCKIFNLHLKFVGKILTDFNRKYLSNTTALWGIQGEVIDI